MQAKWLDHGFELLRMRGKKEVQSSSVSVAGCIQQPDVLVLSGELLSELLSPQPLLQPHLVMAGLALGKRGKQRGEKERKEGQASILGAGLCLEPIMKVEKGNLSVLTAKLSTLLKNLESSMKSFDQAYCGEVCKVENHLIWAGIHS